MPQYKEMQQAASNGQHAAEGKIRCAPCPMPYAYSLLLNAFNLGAYLTQLLFQPFVAPVEVVNPG